MSKAPEAPESSDLLIEHFPDRSVRRLLQDNEYARRHWTVPLSLTAIMDVPDVLSRFVPTFDTLFLGVKAADPSDLTKTGHPLGWLLSVLQKEHAEKAAISEALITAVSHLKALDSEQVSRVRQALLYFIQLILHRRPVEEREDLIELVKRYSDDEMEVETMAQTTAELLIAEGMEKGIAEGQTDAKREAVLKLLHFRFQRIPDSVTEAVASTQSLSRLDALFEKVMAAESLDEIDF